MNKFELFLKKNSSIILTVCGSIGVITTSVLTVKATAKAVELIEFEKKSKNKDKLTKTEIIKVAWKPYIPPFISGLSTISCIIGCHHLNKQRQAALVSAYDILNKSYNEYKNAVQDVYKLNSDEDIKKQIISKQFDNIEVDEDKVMFFDYQSMRYFESTFKEIEDAEVIFNEVLSKNGYVYLNDLYELLGLEPVEHGYELGWTTVINDNIYAAGEVDFDLERVLLDDGTAKGLECWILEMPYPPTLINY